VRVRFLLGARMNPRLDSETFNLADEEPLRDTCITCNRAILWQSPGWWHVIQPLDAHDPVPVDTTIVNAETWDLLRGLLDQEGPDSALAVVADRVSGHNRIVVACTEIVASSPEIQA
jgi:hypothetical protein